MSELKVFVPIEKINRQIFLIRGHKVMLDRDLAELYSVKVKELNQAVKRNENRFPQDFMFQLSRDEAVNLRSQIVTLDKKAWWRYLPYAFTEQGIAMLSSVLHSERAIAVNIQIIRSFVRLRELLSTHTELARQLIYIRSVSSLRTCAFAFVRSSKQILSGCTTPPSASKQSANLRASL